MGRRGRSLSLAMDDSCTSSTTSEKRPERTAAPPELVPTLHVLSSGDAGPAAARSLVLPAGPFLIGRGVPAFDGLSLPSDRRLSRRHARLEVDLRGAEVRLSDLGSRHGTFLRGRRIDAPAPLRSGDVLRVGDTFLVLRHEPPPSTDGEVPNLLGSSPAMRSLRAKIHRIAASSGSVLVRGESGVGKKALARALHDASGSTGAFIVVHCADPPPGFPAEAARAAAGGTLCLESLHDLPPAAQAQLVAWLDRRPSDAPRLVATTSADLESAAVQGALRRELLGRLCEHVLDVPPLRERPEDVLPLLLAALGSEAPALTPALIEALLLHRWPHNVREIAHIVAHLRTFAPGARRLDLPHLAERLGQPAAADRDPAAGTPVADRLAAAAPAAATARPDASRASKSSGSAAPQAGASPSTAPQAARPSPPPSRDALAELLRAHGGNVAQLARALGRQRRQVYRWVALRGLDPAAFRR